MRVKICKYNKLKTYFASKTRVLSISISIVQQNNAKYQQLNAEKLHSA